MSNIKIPRYNYSNLKRYTTPKQGGPRPRLPEVNLQPPKEKYREDLGSFSLYAAVRPPYSCCRGCGDCEKGKLVGVS